MNIIYIERIVHVYRFANSTLNFCLGSVTPPPPIRPTQRPPPSIKVVINTPQIKIVEIGETTQFNCDGYFIVNNVS